MLDTLRESLGRNASFKLVLVLLLAAMVPCYCVGGALLMVSNNNRQINPSPITATSIALNTTETPEPSITPMGNNPPTVLPTLQATPGDIALPTLEPGAYSTYNPQTLFPPEPITTMAVTPGNVDSGSPLAQCQNEGGQTATVIRTNMNGGVAPNASLFCKKITDNNAIGVQSVLERGVIVAVELTALSGATSIKYFQQPLRVCLEGQGVFLFLDANGAPRTAVALPSTFDDGFTCADVPNPGLVVLTSR